MRIYAPELGQRPLVYQLFDNRKSLFRHILPVTPV